MSTDGFRLAIVSLDYEDGLILYDGTDHSNYVRIWKGRQSLTYRCFDCGPGFYGEEPQEGITDEIIGDGHVIDDEEEIERQVEED